MIESSTTMKDRMIQTTPQENIKQRAKAIR